MIRNRFRNVLMGLITACVALSPAASFAGGDKKRDERPQVDVVFCLDTTASMGGLIHAAKQKIWSISNQIVSGKPTPRLRIGLVAYRDRGDDYVTKTIDLTDDLDAIYGHLMELNAEGGGDIPESVNRALWESVTKMNWSAGEKSLKMIFLVGDAPPKQYAQDASISEICKKASQKSIIINAIQCGRSTQTAEAWKSISNQAKGAYVQIDPRGGTLTRVATPYDKELAVINSKLTDTTLTFGNDRLRSLGEEKKTAAKKLPPAAAVDRAGLAGKTGIAATYDLLDNINKGLVDLEKLKKSELPDSLQTLTLTEQRQYLKKLGVKREILIKRAAELDKKRAKYIVTTWTQKVAEKDQASFEGEVLRILQTQATRAQIRYEVKTKTKK